MLCAGYDDGGTTDRQRVGPGHWTDEFCGPTSDPEQESQQHSTPRGCFEAMRQVVLFQLGPPMDQHVQAGFLHRWFNLTQTQINAFSLGPDRNLPDTCRRLSRTVYVCPVRNRTHILCYQNTGISLSNANAYLPSSVGRIEATPPPAQPSNNFAFGNRPGQDPNRSKHTLSFPAHRHRVCSYR